MHAGKESPSRDGTEISLLIKYDTAGQKKIHMIWRLIQSQTFLHKSGYKICRGSRAGESAICVRVCTDEAEWGMGSFQMMFLTILEKLAFYI